MKVGYSFACDEGILIQIQQAFDTVTGILIQIQAFNAGSGIPATDTGSCYRSSEIDW